MASIVILILGVNFLNSYIGVILANIINDPDRGDLISRFAFGVQLQDQSEGSRLYFTKRLLNSLDFSMFLFGTGEGTGEWAAHNAYLIVLQEDGLYALILLVLSSLFMLFKALKKPAKLSNQLKLVCIEKASLLIVVTWIGTITMNWAQLNQAFPWVFLAFVIVLTDNRLSYRFNKLLTFRNGIIK